MVKKRGLGVYIIFVGGKIIQKLCRSQPGHTTTFSARTILKKFKIFFLLPKNSSGCAFASLSDMMEQSLCAHFVFRRRPPFFVRELVVLKAAFPCTVFLLKLSFFVNFFVSFTLTATSRLRLVL